MFEKLVVIICGFEPFPERIDPHRRIYGKGVLDLNTVAIGPVGGNTGFGNFVHLACSDLDLDPFAVNRDSPRV